MRQVDVFNGDADGICALIQLHLSAPRDSELVTGVKRDIDLLRRVRAGAGDRITVLDVAMEKNRADLDRLLAAGASILYVDHHIPGDIPAHPGLHAIINTAPEVCTSLLVNGHLQGAWARWAVVGAFGDNLAESARRLGAQIGMRDEDLAAAEQLGTYVNYNGYGPSIEDLHFAPADLFLRLRPYADPLAFIADDRESFATLEQGFRGDMSLAAALQPIHETPAAAVFLLPDEPWARRVSGVYSNDLVNLHPDRAHAVLTEIGAGDLLVSVRAPLANRTGADEICRQFPTGGGRKAAAGINRLAREDLARFIDVFCSFYAARTSS
jgi:hypothetical protein